MVNTAATWGRSPVLQRSPAVLVLFVFYLYVICYYNLALWLQYFNKLTYLLTVCSCGLPGIIIHIRASSKDINSSVLLVV